MKTPTPPPPHTLLLRRTSLPQETDNAAAEQNDDHQLCRFEFLEIMTRMACAKYRRGKQGYAGPCATVAYAVQLFIEEHLLKMDCPVNDSELLPFTFHAPSPFRRLHRADTALVPYSRAHAVSHARTAGMLATSPVDDFRLRVLYTEETEDALGPHWQLLQVRAMPPRWALAGSD